MMKKIECVDDAVKVLNRERHLGYKSWGISEEGWVFTGGVTGRLLMPSHAIAIATAYEAGKETEEL